MAKTWAWCKVTSLQFGQDHYLVKKMTSNHSSFDNNFSFVGSKPFCNILLYSKALKVFSQWSSSAIPAAKIAPHTMTPLPPCFTVVEEQLLLYFSTDFQRYRSITMQLMFQDLPLHTQVPQIFDVFWDSIGLLIGYFLKFANFLTNKTIKSLLFCHFGLGPFYD